MIAEGLAYSVQEAAYLLGISRDRMWALRDRGQISFTRIDEQIVVRAEELQRFLNEQPTYQWTPPDV